MTAESALPSSWADARDAVLANAPWIFLLIAGERAFDEHYVQAAIALLLCFVSFGVAIYWKVFEGLTKPEGRHRLSFILITIGALILATGIYFLSTREASHEDKAKIDELNTALQTGRDTVVTLNGQLASSRSEIQNLQSRLDAAARSPPQAPALSPEQQEFRALLQINKNLAPGDRERLSDALFDFSKFLDLANETFGKANQARGEYIRLQRDPSQIGEQTKKLELLVQDTILMKKDFVRVKWRFYKRQLDYVFGKEPDNNALKLQNGMAHIQNFLEIWSQIDSKNAAATRLLGYPTTAVDEYLTGFSQWQQGCQNRLRQMQESLQ